MTKIDHTMEASSQESRVRVQIWLWDSFWEGKATWFTMSICFYLVDIMLGGTKQSTRFFFELLHSKYFLTII